MKNHGDAGDYQSLLETLLKHYEIAPLMDYPKPGKVCYLRHDVDASPDNAVQMAEIEHEIGVKSTFYILPTRKYFRRSKQQVVYLKELGSEVGLHHTALQGNFGEYLDKLKDIGIDVKTVSAHGSLQSREERRGNYAAFDKISLKDLGLREAYFMHRDAYICDSKGGWRYTFEQGVDEWTGKLVWVKMPIRDFIGSLKVDQIQLLTHPCWWDL